MRAKPLINPYTGKPYARIDVDQPATKREPVETPESPLAIAYRERQAWYEQNKGKQVPRLSLGLKVKP